jgi:hypothetical protein
MGKNVQVISNSKLGFETFHVLSQFTLAYPILSFRKPDESLLITTDRELSTWNRKSAYYLISFVTYDVGRAALFYRVCKACLAVVEVAHSAFTLSLSCRV